MSVDERPTLMLIVLLVSDNGGMTIVLTSPFPSAPICRSVTPLVAIK